MSTQEFLDYSQLCAFIDNSKGNEKLCKQFQSHKEQVNSLMQSFLFKSGQVAIIYISGLLYIKCKTGVNKAPCQTCCKRNARKVEGGCVSVTSISAWMTTHGITIDRNDIISKVCEVCSTTDNEHLLLICSKCNKAYHTYCLEMEEVPEEEDWQCPLCVHGMKSDNKSSNISLLVKKVQTMECDMIKLRKRIFELERVGAYNNKRKKYMDMKIEGGGKGKCKKCGVKTRKNKKDDVIRYSPPWIVYNIMSSSLARTMCHTDFISKILNENKYCAECKTEMGIVPGGFFDTRNKHDQCMLCRTSRVAKSTNSCSSCAIISLQTNHAEFKQPLQNCMKLLEHTVECIAKVTTSFDMDPNGIHKHEYPVDEYGKIDFLIEVIDNDDNKHMFAIEVLASKTEDMRLMPHKMLRAKQKLNPFRSYFVMFDIQDRNIEYSCLERLEILRRWIIFAVKYYEYLPSINLWSLFSEGRKPFTVNDNHHTFYHHPVVISHAPKGLVVDWEFCVDPYICSNRDKSVFKKINENAVCLNSMLFANMFEKGNVGRYALYNIDTFQPPLLCKMHCDTCTGLLLQNGGKGI